MDQEKLSNQYNIKKHEKKKNTLHIWKQYHFPKSKITLGT